MKVGNEKNAKIIAQILKIFNINYESHKYFNNGASSRVILLNNKHLIKQNTTAI